MILFIFFFFQAEDGIRDGTVTGVQTCALPISEGYAVDAAFDGQSGLDTFRAAQPSAVVLDLRLPGMPGRDVCREIKQTAPTVPVLGSSLGGRDLCLRRSPG